MRPLWTPSKMLLQVWMKLRRLLPRQRCQTFRASKLEKRSKIETIYVINLDRRPDRWAEVRRELMHVEDNNGFPLADLAVRVSAVDAKDIAELPTICEDVCPFYTLRDQLFVEPQPFAFPEQMELSRKIPMTVQEIAVALSHISVWRKIADGDQEYALVLEDDVWFQNGFAQHLDQAWNELIGKTEQEDLFDMLYLSYKEVLNGAQKTFFTENTFIPIRGLWYLSGYVLSRRGACKLLQNLPCRGPIDLWINHQFEELLVRATRRSEIAQRLDGQSSNSYSILPVLNKIGIIDSEGASLFQVRPTEYPVFAFGPINSGLSSLAQALSMLGYRCCSDCDKLPQQEHERLLAGSNKRIFDAYVNIGSLTENIQELRKRYPTSKFIATVDCTEHKVDILNCTEGKAEYDAVLYSDEKDKWQILCELLKGTSKKWFLIYHLKRQFLQ